MEMKLISFKATRRVATREITRRLVVAERG